MTDFYIPDEHELDALLDQPPQFDLNAVKRHTLSRIDMGDHPPSKRRAPLRYLLVAAVICILSVSTLATDYAMIGPITRTLGLRKPAEIQEPLPVEEPQPPSLPPAPQAKPEPEPLPVPEPPELDQQIADVLQISPSQSQNLRPAVQKVEQIVEDQDVRMTVLQTLGDPSCLYVKLRFDFPEATPANENLEFDKMSFRLEGADGYSWGWTVLAQTPQSITYLLHVRLSGVDVPLNGLTATMSVKDYGIPHHYTEDEVIHLAGEDGVPYTTILYPDGTILRDPDERTLAALPPESSPPIVYEHGFTVSRREDGTKVVTYDGKHGDQLLENVCLVPDFDPVIEGQWEQSWVLSYEDLSRYWEGEAVLSDPRLTLTQLRLSPLSWDMRLTVRELTGEELGPGLVYERIRSVQLLLKDGTVMDVPTGPLSGSSYETQEDIYTITNLQQGSSFEHPVDLSDVVGMVIEGKEFHLPPTA